MVQIFDNINYFWHTSVMPKLLLIPLEDTVVFPGMDVTLPVDVGDESRVLLVPRHGSDYANVGVVAELFGLSRSEARRLIEQGGVRIDDRVVDGGELDLPLDGLDGAVVQVGKRRHKRLRVER